MKTMQRLGVLAGLSVLGTVVFATAAFAAGGGSSPGFFSGLTVTQAAVLAGLVVPILVALMTKSSASVVVKGLTLAVLAAVGAVVAALAGVNAPDSITVGFVLNTGFPVFVAAVASYFGFYKPVLNINERALPEKGIG